MVGLLNPIQVCNMLHSNFIGVLPCYMSKKIWLGILVLFLGLIGRLHWGCEIAMHLSYFWYHWWIGVQISYPRNDEYYLGHLHSIGCNLMINKIFKHVDYFESLLLFWEDNWIEIHFSNLNWWNIVGAIISIFQANNVC